jgi:hypothetical protein
MSTIKSSLTRNANAVRSAVKAKFGISDNIRGRREDSAAGRKWVFKVARLTDKVQAELEGLLDCNTTSMELTNEDFVEWATLSEFEAHRFPPLVVGLYEAFAAGIAASDGVDWIQDQVAGLEEQADRLEERGTDRASEKADQLRELKDELEEIAHTMESNQAWGSDSMVEAIEAGDLEQVRQVLDEGEFLLDIGAE